MKNKESNEIYKIFNTIAPVYDLLNRILSLYQDIHWRHFVAHSIYLTPNPNLILDIATGTGDLAITCAKRTEKPFVIGLDPVPAMINIAYHKILPSQKIFFLIAESIKIPFPKQQFNAVTIGFGIRNIPNRIQAMTEIRRVLIPGGRLYILEFAHPENSLIKKFYQFYLNKILPKIGGTISGNYYSYKYLAKTIMSFPSPNKFKIEMKAAGLIKPRSYRLTKGIVWLHIAERPF